MCNSKRTSHLARPRLSYAILSLWVLLAGCATTTLPERWSTAKDAFPSKADMIPPADKTGVFEVTSFTAPYEDVYRAASVSASQAMLDVTAESKDDGYILAEQIPQGKPGIHYYYAITVDELGPKQSRVTIMSKMQAQCVILGSGYSIATLGILPAAQHATGETDEACRENSQVHWGGDPTQFKQFMSFVRNNLIAAGVY